MTWLKKRPLLILVAAVALTYGNSLRNDFTQDDFYYIVDNSQLHGNPLRLFFAPHENSNTYRPVTTFSYALNAAIGGMRPASFHLGNIALHALVTVLLFLLIRDLLGSTPVALATAWLFAVHPIHTEAVTAAVGRAELLAACFLLAAWIMHVRDCEWPALGFYLLAMMSKESTIVLPALLVAGDWARGHWPPLRRYARMMAVTGLYVGLLWWMQGGRLGRPLIDQLDNPLVALPAGWRILNALRVAWIYAGLQAFPVHLSADYSYNAIPVSYSLTAAALVVLGTLTVFAAWCWTIYRRKALGIVAGAIYFFCFATTANVLVPIGTILGERLAYLPSAGFCLLAAGGWYWLRGKTRKFSLGLLGFLVALLAMRTVVRNRDWQDNFKLYLAAVEVVPESAKAHNNLGAQFIDHGHPGMAREEYEEAMRIYPNYGDMLASYGLLEFRSGHKTRAAWMMERALGISGRDNPNYDTMAINYAALLMDAGRLDGALAILNGVIAASPGQSRALANRAVIHYKNNDLEAARSDADAALRIDAKNKQALGILRLLSR